MSSEGTLDRGPIPNNLSLADIDSLQLSRIYRKSQVLGLSTEVQAELKTAISEGFKETVAATSEHPVTLGSKRCELKIRQLVRSEASWQEIKGYAWQLFRFRGTSEAASKLVELVYLYGSIHETLDVLAVLNEEGYDYYFHLHEKIRTHLALTLWRNKKFETLDLFLLENSGEMRFLPLEHLYVFSRLLNDKDTGNCFMYFQSNEADLVRAAKEFGDKIGLPETRFYFDVGQLSVTLGFNKTARRVLEWIRPDHEEYAEAIQLMMLVNVDKSDPATRNYFEKLKRETSWRDRLKLIASFIEECRHRMSERDIRRPALNEILARPLTWVPALPVSYAEVSRIIAANLDLQTYLPGIAQVFKDNALVFHAPSLDAALWSGFEESAQVRDGARLYWHGVSLLHRYVNLGDCQETLIWQAKNAIFQAKEIWTVPLPVAWDELHKSACAWVAKSHHISEKKRGEMLRQMKVAADFRSLGMREIEEYIEVSSEQPYLVLKELQIFAQEKQTRLLEKKILLSMSRSRSLTNSQLERLWQLSCELGDQDFAWRVATVLEGRMSLGESAAYAWSISGEKRSVYPFLEPTKEQLDLCMAGMSADERKLCNACIKIGPLLPELLAALDSEVKAVKLPSPPSDSFEAGVEKALAKVDWLVVPKKHYRFSFDGFLSASIQLPGFIHILPSNMWSYLYVKLAERLGLNAWSWQLSKLHKQIEELLPRIASRAGLDHFSTKVARWLKQLSSEQRSAWLDLTQLSQKIDDTVGVETLADFVARLAIVINPAHVQALKSLRIMRAPLSTVRSLERWLVSDEYSQIRRELQLSNRIPVPASIKRGILPKTVDV